MQAEFETETETLKRIATMLLALAVLADRACFASGPVRWFVLLLLRPAISAARGIVADLTRLPADSFADLDVLQHHDGIPEAMRLAHEFRVLAAALYEYLLWAAWAASQASTDDGGYSGNISTTRSAPVRHYGSPAPAPARRWILRIDDS